MENTNYTERLCLLRRACGLTQQELADKIGVSRVMLNKYETQGIIPRRDTLNKLASALDVTPKELIFGKNIP